MSSDYQKFDEKPWVKPISDLCEHLSQSDQKFHTFREVDSKILDVNSSIIDVVQSATEGLKKTIGTCRVFFFYNVGSFEEDIFRLLSEENQDSPLFLPNDILVELMQEQGHILILDRVKAAEIGIGGLERAEVALALVEADIGDVKCNFGILAVESSDKYHSGSITDLGYHKRFIYSISKQLSVGIKDKLSDHANEFLRNTYNELFYANFKPRICFDTLAKKISSFLSGGFNFLPKTDPIYCEILVKDHFGGGKWLAIRGTTESSATKSRLLIRIQIEQSVSGMLFLKQGNKKDKIEPILCDPTVDDECKKVYKYYLGRDNKENKPGNRSEFVLPIYYKNTMFGVINLESPHENAFKKPHIWLAEYMAKILSGVIYALDFRISRTDTLQKGVVQHFDSQLGMLSRQYFHKTDNTNSGIRIKLDSIKESISLLEERLYNSDENTMSLINNLKEDQMALDSFFQTTIVFQKEFANDMTGFAKYKQWSVKSLLDDAIRLNNPDYECTNFGINIEKFIDFDFNVFCNQMLRDVFFNIINNSIYWVKRRKDNFDNDRPIVRINLSSGPEQKERQEQDLNKLCKIVFYDNGPGVDKNTKDRLFEPGFSLRTGDKNSGFGLYFSKEYVEGLGGIITVESELDKFFQVTIVLHTICTDILSTKV